jgi:transcriptional regulator with XRE-family HTH domain
MSNEQIKVADIRLGLGMTLSQFAMRLGVSASTVSRVENGNIKMTKKFSHALREAFPDRYNKSFQTS